MKNRYIDIMDKALSAYTAQRIRAFVDTVRREGLTEHGFPRLGANIGILLAHGRRPELKNIFIDIIELCLDAFPHVPWTAGNNFSIREVCCALLELEKSDVIDKALLSKWKTQLAELDPWRIYSHIVSEECPTPANWAYFGVVSEQARGLLCGIDTTAFLEHQLPSQLLRLDENGMYRDAGLEGPHQPLLYDLMTRVLLGLSFYWGYRGKYAQQIVRMMTLSDDLTLKMQSVTGEIPFGGRSNQFLFNETVLASYYELRATLLAQEGEFIKAGQFKAAAQKASQATLKWLLTEPMSHIKNSFDPDLQFGCESYAYFNKYMITVASNAYIAYLVADDDIAPTAAISDTGSYIIQTGPDFHKVFVDSNGYYLEFDLNADTHYDANGLGRVHKSGCPAAICLSVPFPGAEANYKIEPVNPQPMSLCCAGGASTPYTLLNSRVTEETATATFLCDKGTENYTITSSGIDIAYGQRGFMLPVFVFDGKTYTDIQIGENAISVHYQGAVCTYRFNGIIRSMETYYNRNGQYSVYYIDADHLHIKIA